MKKMLPLLLFTFAAMFGCSSKADQDHALQEIKLGVEVLLDEHISELKGKRVGLLMNPTSRIEGVHMLDTLLNLNVNVTALFAAEHGFRGDAGAGEIIEDGIDQETGIPVYSLYGSSKKPTSEMLDKIDLLLFDLPDMGVRFYTYNVTMGLALEAIAESDKEMWILDRPNPLGGNYVAGWILEPQFKSFVGAYPIPVVYGMTMGELAKMAVGEGWLEISKKPNYRIIRAKGWERSMLWPDTGLNWVPPSPNLPSFEHAFAYAGTVIFEGTNLSEGRGTADPFLMFGSPSFSYNQSAASKIEKEHHIRLDSVSFTPKSIPGKAISPKYEDQRSYGYRLSFDEGFEKTSPLKMGLDLLQFAQVQTKDFEITTFANKLFGIDIKSVLEHNEEIPSWNEEVNMFKKQRAEYLLY